MLAQELIQKIDAESTGMGGGGSTGDSDAGSGDQSQMASSLKNPIEMAVQLEIVIFRVSDSDPMAYKQLSNSVIESIVGLNLPQDLEQFVKSFQQPKGNPFASLSKPPPVRAS